MSLINALVAASCACAFITLSTIIKKNKFARRLEDEQTETLLKVLVQILNYAEYSSSSRGKKLLSWYKDLPLRTSRMKPVVTVDSSAVCRKFNISISFNGQTIQAHATRASLDAIEDFHMVNVVHKTYTSRTIH